MKQKKTLVNFRLNESDAEELKDVSDRLDRPQSEIVREAIKEKVAKLKRKIEPENAAVEVS